MDEIDRYLSLVDSLSSWAMDHGSAPAKLMEAPDTGEIASWVEEAIDLRQQLLSEDDHNRYFPHLTLGYLKRYEGDKRIPAFAVLFDLERCVAIRSIERFCLPYEPSQPLFQAVPGLWKRVRQTGKRPPDLLSADGFDWDASGQLVDFGHTQARLGCSSEVVSWLRENCPSSPLFVRLHPFVVGPSLLATLCEEVIQPINPKWWSKLEMWPNTRSFGRYELLECDARENREQYWERNVQHFGRLEVLFRREGSGLLTGMLEELPRPVAQPYLRGLCLHVTSDSPVGTLWDAGLAAHIDGALNVYKGDAVDQRWDSKIEDKVDATFRTHLFRIDNVPLRVILPLASLFFRSKCLLRDWLDDQFSGSAPDGSA